MFYAFMSLFAIVASILGKVSGAIMNIQEVTSMLADHFPKFKVTVIEKMQVGMTRWAQEGTCLRSNLFAWKS